MGYSLWGHKESDATEAQGHLSFFFALTSSPFTLLYFMRAYFSPPQREPSYTVVGNVGWCSHYRKCRKLKIGLPYDPAIPLLDVYPDKAIIQKDICTLMFTVAQFTMAKT